MSNKNLKKKDLINNLSSKTGYSLSFSKKLCDDFFDILIDNIKLGNCKITNIGSSKVMFKKERIGRNPKTKEEYKVSSRKSVIFKTSKNITKKLDKLL